MQHEHWIQQRRVNGLGFAESVGGIEGTECATETEVVGGTWGSNGKVASLSKNDLRLFQDKFQKL